jgi:hypothetical protein
VCLKGGRVLFLFKVIQLKKYLQDFYAQLSDKKLEIVYVSSDANESEMREFMLESHGDWCYIPFGDSGIE